MTKLSTNSQKIAFRSIDLQERLGQYPISLGLAAKHSLEQYFLLLGEPPKLTADEAKAIYKWIKDKPLYLRAHLQSAASAEVSDTFRDITPVEWHSLIEAIGRVNPQKKWAEEFQRVGLVEEEKQC